MNKFNKVAALFATVALAGGAYAEDINNWRATDGTVWKNGTNELCWRDNFWTPQTGVQGCDGVPKPAAPAPAPVPVAEAPAPVVPAPAPVAAAPVPEKVTIQADALFDFDKSALKPEGKAKLDELADKVKGLSTVDAIVATGHTDSIGTVAYNQKLSLRRAETVKAYLVSKGVDASKVFTEGKGKSQPVADNKTAEGRAKNRRVEVELDGKKEVTISK